MPASLAEALAFDWILLFGQPTDVHRLVPLSGGSINQVYRVETATGPVVLKYHPYSDFAVEMFAAERVGLELLTASGTVRCPRILGWGQTPEVVYHLLEYIPPRPPDTGVWESLAVSLASLHASARQPEGRFGLESPNFIGSLCQLNEWCTTAAEFYITQRLEPQVRQAVDVNRLERHHIRLCERLYTRLEQLLPPEPAVLNHGDLWLGNILPAAEGPPAVLDPAVAYHHREADLAFTRLFGSFGPAFYLTYQEAYPLEPGFEQRLPIWQLYPLLVHLNLFGESYREPILKTLHYFAR